jgi:antibiotic biosynthesis monooxygenase (ABM) superfamily enzyme
MDTDKPIAWEGSAPEHVVMVQFDNPDQAQAWKSSDVNRHRSRTPSRMTAML